MWNISWCWNIFLTWNISRLPGGVWSSRVGVGPGEWRRVRCEPYRGNSRAPSHPTTWPGSSLTTARASRPTPGTAPGRPWWRRPTLAGSCPAAARGTPGWWRTPCPPSPGRKSMRIRRIMIRMVMMSPGTKSFVTRGSDQNYSLHCTGVQYSNWHNWYRQKILSLI